jgi:hypothetical protein
MITALDEYEKVRIQFTVGEIYRLPWTGQDVV